MNKQRPSTRKHQIFYILAPIGLLILCLSTINIVYLTSKKSPIIPPTLAALPTNTPTLSQRPTPLSLPPTASLQLNPTQQTLPTVTESAPIPTPYSQPIYTDSDVITLFGPPENSTFSSTNTLLFYWQWGQQLKEDQSFTLYFFIDGEIKPIASLEEANVGGAYRLSVDMEEDAQTAVSLQWFIQLHSIHTDTPLRTSDIRNLHQREN